MNRMTVCAALLGLFAAVQPAAAGYFKVMSVWSEEINRGSYQIEVVIEAAAKYVGKVDRDDKNALIQTALRDDDDGAVDSAGTNYRKPFHRGQYIHCTGPCGARKYLRRPVCASMTTVGEARHYQGVGKVAILHVPDPDIHTKNGVIRQLPCFSTSTSTDWNGSYPVPSILHRDLDRNNGGGGGGGCGYTQRTETVEVCMGEGSNRDCQEDSTITWMYAC